VITDGPPKGKRDGPSKDIDPGDSHSGEGLASVGPRLAKTLADSAVRTSGRQQDPILSRTPLEPTPEPAGAPDPTQTLPQNEKSPAAIQRG
jgi:hypothetical protein